MKVERLRPAVLQVTFHAFELAALIAAARWIVEGAEGELPPESKDQLQQVLDSYDQEVRRLESH